MRYRIQLKALAPLALTKSRATGNQLDTLGYIPGSAWRGALARALIEGAEAAGQRPENHPAFRQLFLEGRVRFGDLRPVSARPFPLSARRCTRDGLHPVQDGLLTQLTGKRHARVCGAPTSSKACDAKLGPESGFVFVNDHGRIDRSRMASQLPQRRVVAHTAIDNESLRVRDAQFHTSVLLDRGAVFAGDLYAADAGGGALAKKWIEKAQPLIVGRGGTRGQGLAELTIEEAKNENSDLATRLRGLNQFLSGSGHTGFTITAQSPCLAYDEWMSARPYLTTGDLEEAGGAPGAFEGYRLHYWSSRLARVSGWNAQAGLPKPDAFAIAPGSAFVFVKAVPAAEREKEVDRLGRELERVQAALGDRWEEGFGEVVFCDEFHYRHCRGTA